MFSPWVEQNIPGITMTLPMILAGWKAASGARFFSQKLNKYVSQPTGQSNSYLREGVREGTDTQSGDKMRCCRTDCAYIHASGH